MKNIDWPFFILVFALFAIGNAADYFYQADLHGWFNPLWENGARAPHWPDLWGWLPVDWFPHDGWHIAQTLNNTLDKLASGILAWHFGREDYFKRTWVQFVVMLAVGIGLYLAARGATFSLLLKVWN